MVCVDLLPVLNEREEGQNGEIRTCRVGGKRAFVTTPLNCF